MTPTSDGQGNPPDRSRRAPVGTSTGEPRAGATRVVAASERFAARGRAAARRPRLLAALALALVVLAALGVWLVRYSPVLDVRTVAVRGASGALASQVESVAAVPRGRPLATVDLAAVGRRVTSVTAVESARVERVWPHTLRIVVSPRTAVIAVSAGSDTGGSVRLVDKHGVAFGTADKAPSGVPVVAASQTADGRALAGAVTMMSALPSDLRSTVSKVNVESAASMSFMLGSTTVRWGDASEPELKVKVIRALLATKPQVIDVTAPKAPATS